MHGSGNALPSRASRLVIGRGLVSAADIHRFGLCSRDLSQSNGVALVECGDGRGWVVKDMHRRRDESQGSPAAELALYRAAADRPELSELVPRLVGYDAERSVMILECLVSARRLDQVAEGKRALDPELGTLLGTALGRWHRAAKDLTGALPTADPWMLHIDGGRRLDVLDEVAGLRAVIERILADDVNREIPVRVREGWRAETVIHGDVRFANTLVDTSPPTLRLVDWETGGRGDPAWDLGAAVQEYLSLTLAFGHRSVASSPALPALRALTAAYRASGGSEMPWSRLAPHVACRLLMRAVQLANWEQDPGDAIDRHLQLARVVATRGEEIFDPGGDGAA